VLETLLLLRYQMSNGVVYRHVGWLLTCFMAGMTAGSFAVGGIGLERVRGRGGIPTLMLGVSSAAWLALAWIPAASGLVGTSALLGAVGAAIGAAFSVGAAGAVIATLVLVPAAGLDGSALLMAALAASLFVVIPRSGSAGR